MTKVIKFPKKKKGKVTWEKWDGEPTNKTYPNLPDNAWVDWETGEIKYDKPDLEVVKKDKGEQ